MKVLVVGSGGREHAMGWKLAQSPKVQQVYVAPGNGGTAKDKNLVNVPITDLALLRQWALDNGIGLTLVGPEAPLAAGIVDDFRSHGLRIFGPTQAAAQLESSKAFSKAFMRRHGIPTAAFETFTDAAQAHAYVDRQGAPIVVKADGLAAGKGVVVAMSLAEAHEAIDFMLLENTLGVTHNVGGARVVIEEFLQGEEASFMVLCDGKNVAALATSQDHKRYWMATRAPTQAAWVRIHPRPWSLPRCTRAPCARSSCPPSAAWRKTASTTPAFCMRG
jgi:phosphoribosylamine--glycine ligase